MEKLGVAIIQSLKAEEKQTGKELYDTTLKYITFSKPYLENDFFDINNKEEFFKTLNKITFKAKTENKFYFLHFEIHGNAHGIELKNGDFITWKLLLEPLRELNILYRNKLSVYLAVCEGNSLIRAIDPLGRSPFAFILGSFFKIYDSDILNSFEKFYTIFFENFKIAEAFEEMKKVSSKSDFTIITSDYVVDTLIEMAEKSNDREKMLKIFDDTFDSTDTKLDENLVQKIKKQIMDAFDSHKIVREYYLMEDI